MPDLPKRILTLSAAVAALFLLASLAVWARFDSADFGRRIVAWTQEKEQRELRLDGGVRLALFPRPALVLERGVLSGRGGAVEFAAFDQARLNLAWSALLGGPLRVTSVALRGLRAEVAAAGSFAGGAESDPLQFAIGELRLERADLRFGPADDSQLHLDRALARFDGGALDIEGSGAGLGLRELELRVQSAPAGNARNLALALNGLRGAEKFDLRLTAGALRSQPEGYGAEDVNLVLQLVRGDDSFDVALRITALAGSLETANAQKAVLAVNRGWKNGRLTLTYNGAASLGLAGNWLEWPAVRLEVNLLEAGKSELSRVWNGTTRFEAAAYAGALR